MSIRFLKRESAPTELFVDAFTEVAVVKNTLVKFDGDGTVSAATTNETYAGITHGTAKAPETIDTGDTTFYVQIIPADDETIFSITPQAAVTVAAAKAKVGSYNDLNGSGASVTVATVQGVNNDVLIVGYNSRIGQTNIDSYRCKLNDRAV
jgi:hypothetical protein